MKTKTRAPALKPKLIRAGHPYPEVWRAAEVYMRARRNDVHIPLSYGYARQLLEAYPDADEDIVSLAIILHDIGWWSIDIADILSMGFGPNMMQSDVRFLHEAEGVRLATPILKQLGWPAKTINAVCEIIDGHDTRKEPKSLNDRLVRDADKLWRFTPTGVAIAGDWLKMTPSVYCKRLQTEILPILETEEAVKIATKRLAKTREALLVDLI